MTQTAFRVATRDDLPAIVALLADDALRREADPASLDAYDKGFAAIEASPDNEIIIGEREGAVIACLQLTLIPGLSRGGASRALIEAVRVASSLRGRRIGEALIGFALDRARAKGARLAQLTSDARRPDAHRFYERLGFSASHTGFKLEL